MENATHKRALLWFPKDQIDLKGLKEEVKPPPYCDCGSAIKDDAVFFGEAIPGDVLRKSEQEAWQCDLMLICGTTAVVYPFANLPEVAKMRRGEREAASGSGPHLVQDVPSTVVIEVNAYPTPLTRMGVSDYIIQGKTGEILPRIVQEMRRLKGL